VEKSVTRGRLAALLREAEAAHAEYEGTLGRRDDDWSEWYAAFIIDRLPASLDAADQVTPPSTEPFLGE
jgi:hypothetical protein